VVKSDWVKLSLLRLFVPVGRPSEAVAKAGALEEEERRDARERQEELRENRAKNYSTRNESEKGRAKDKVVRSVGMSSPTL
jgi:hypothetical protein